MREKGVSNSSIPPMQKKLFLEVQSAPAYVWYHNLTRCLSLHKSMSDDLCTSKTAFRQLDTLFSSFLCTLCKGDNSRVCCRLK